MGLYYTETEVRQISEVTRRDIAKLFIDGYYDYSGFWPDSKYSSPDDAKILYVYYGNLTEIEFLRKLYPLDEMPSMDSRYPNAVGDICQHTINNDDWEFGWVFRDSRFGLLDGDDKILLEFLCAVFHPAIRKEDGYWDEYLRKIQMLLHPDGYELYVSTRLSGRNVYSWRVLTNAEIASKTFLPFSVRYKDDNISVPKIGRAKRLSLVRLMTCKEDNEYLTTETGLNYNLPTRKAVLEDLKNFYTPKAYNESGKYSEETDFDKLCMKTSRKSVFDIIELYASYKDESFEVEVNAIIQDIGYKLIDGKLMSSQPQIRVELPLEPSLRGLIQTAERYFVKEDAESKQLALEKLWDAFEKLRTYYSPDKKKSMERLIDKIAGGDASLAEKFSTEFMGLGEVGNKYQIRHFETGKIPISDVRLKEYWYQRCLSLINLSIKFIEDNRK